MPAIRKTLPLSLGILVAWVVSATFAQPSSTPGQSPVDDSFQPVVVTGRTLGAFLHTPIDQLFAYVYENGTWTQIPYQIDEKALNEAGQRVYTVTGDGQLDADEELVFMLKDMGDQAPFSAWVEGADGNIRIEMAVKAGDGGRRWAYLFRGSELNQTFTQDYVLFSGPARRVVAERYQIGFLENGFGLGELRLNDSGINILDRTKLRLKVVVLGFLRLTYTEDDLPVEPKPIAPLKDGPVRLVWGENGGFAYGSLFQTRNEIDLSNSPIPGTSIEGFRFSLDFNRQVVATSTSTIYLDANVSEPVIIDGQPDTVPTEPVPAWRQISHTTGTVVQTVGLSSVGGTQRNYYKDDETEDDTDTGDKLSYGDSGFSVTNPNISFVINTTLLILPPTWENVGATYAEMLATPPAVTPTLQTPAGPLHHKVYLPLQQ